MKHFEFYQTLSSVRAYEFPIRLILATQRVSRELRRDIFGVWYFYFVVIKLFINFLYKFRNGRNAFETEMETYKLYIAASKYCAQFDPIPHIYYGSIEQAALGLCSLVGVSTVRAGCSCCREC